VACSAQKNVFCWTQSGTSGMAGTDNGDDILSDFLDFFKVSMIRLYLYGGLGWWFGSLGNQSYVQNRFEKCVFVLCVLYLFYFLFN